MSGDGIYSGVLTSYPAIGRYTVTIRVAGNEHTKVPKIGALATRSAGSAVHFDADQLEPTGTFTRTVRGPIVHLRTLPDTSRIPPGKITDLAIEIGEGGRLYSTWHSAGGDLASGSVTGFKFYYSSDISSLVGGSPRPLVNVDRLTAAGSLATQDLAFPFYDKDYYIGLVAVDADGNVGPMSNLAHVFLPAPAQMMSESVELDQATGPNFSLLNSEKDWIMVGVICGILLVLIVISIVSISYFCCVTRKGSSVDRKATTVGGSISDVHVVSSGSSDHTDGTDAGSFDSDIKNLSGNNMIVQGYEHRELEFGLPRYPHHGGEGMETPTKDGNSTRGTPVYWSASQLLSKLEEGSAGSYSPHHEYAYQYGTPRGVHHGHGLEVAPAIADYVERSVSIPDEFCITVSNLPPTHQQYVDRIAAVDSFRYSNRRLGGERMPPPPLFPKPKNITQV